MKGFFKYMLATISGILISSLILFFIFLMIIGSIASKSRKDYEVKPNSILELKLDKPIKDRDPDDPFEHFDFLNRKPIYQLGLNNILRQIEKASTDENIKGIYLDLSFIGSGLGTVEEIRDALITFKESGKFIISYGEFYDKKAYYLASVSDQIYLNPTGFLEFFGLKSEVTFFKGTLEKLGVQVQVFREGKYKSATEQLTSDKLSEPNKAQLSEMVNIAWNHMLDGIASFRKIPAERLNDIASGLLVNSPHAAAELSLIDGVRYEDEVLEELSRLAGTAGQSPKLVSLKQYQSDEMFDPQKMLNDNKIAVIYASGPVQLGDEGEGTISSERMVKAIRQARKDKNVKAVVLRVNSGGGSMLAADIILRELKLLKAEKPLVASFGDIAASGGYYIASQADTIVTNPLCITGSIGVFGLLMNSQKFMQEKLGITSGIVKTNPYADIGSVRRPMEEAEKKYFETSIDRAYQEFLDEVATGRNSSTSEINTLAQGRIWNGKSAVENGLADATGGLNQAIDLAARMTNLATYEVQELPKLEDPITRFMKEYFENARVKMISNELGELGYHYITLKEIIQMDQVQMRIPFHIELN